MSGSAPVPSSRTASWRTRRKLSQAVKTASRSRSRLNHRLALLSALLKNISMSHCGVSESSWPQSLRPATGRTRVWSPPPLLHRDSPVSLRETPNPFCHRRGWARQLDDCRTTRRMINKWCMRNYIFIPDSQSGVWESAGSSPSDLIPCFVGHNFMLLQSLMCVDVWFD